MSAAGATNDHKHGVPVWTLFIALLILTALEVGFYKVWVESQQDAVAQNTVLIEKAEAAGTEVNPNDLAGPFVPKIAMVLVLLVGLTLPKMFIVLVYFMHLKFEKQFITALVVFPTLLIFVCVVPPLSDTLRLDALGSSAPSQISADQIGVYHAHGEEPEAPTEEEEEEDY